MEQIDDYTFGHTYDKKIPEKDADRFAYVFGEGSPALTELIRYCIINNIRTLASCKGHPEDRTIIEKPFENGYITFKFDKEFDNDDFAYFLAAIPFSNKNLKAHLECNYITDRTLTLEVPARSKNMSEKYFIYILEAIKEYKKMKDEGKKIKVNPQVKQIVDQAFYSYNDYNFYEITYRNVKMFERKGLNAKRVAKCPSYRETTDLHEKFGMAENMEEFLKANYFRK